MEIITVNLMFDWCYTILYVRI